jgi:DNA repair protein RecN (Recombination protein N)
VGPFGDYAAIRLAFDVDEHASWWEALTDLGVTPDSTLIVERRLGRDGRSQIKVQGQPVPASIARGALDELADVAGQHEHQQLLRAEHARQWVDGLVSDGVKEALERAWEGWRAVVVERERLSELTGRPDEAAAIREDWQYLKTVAPDPEEEERLHAQMGRWGQATRLAELLRGLEAAIDGTDGGGAVQLVGEVARQAEEVSRLDAESARAWPDLARGALEALTDLSREVYRLADSLDYDPAEAARIEERLDVLARAGRRFQTDTAGLKARLDELGEQVNRIDGAVWEAERLAKREAEAAAAYGEAADALRRERGQAVGSSLPKVTGILHRLDLPNARLELTASPADPGPHGDERWEWRFSSHPRQDPRPLARVASGGELARVALALRAVQGGESVLLLDEVDVGLGGQAARQVASLLGDLALRQQVVAVSHQPVVAARADAHWRLVRRDDPDNPLTDVERLEGEARVEEVARMLSGSDDREAVAHARRLMSERSERTDQVERGERPDPPAAESAQRRETYRG